MILDDIRDKVKKQVSERGAEDLYIRGLWAVDCLFNPDPKERVFNYKFIIAQTIGQGCAYSPITEYKSEDLKNLIGKNYIELGDMNLDLGLEIAVLDAIFSTRCSTPDVEYELSGDSIQKAIGRAEIIAKEAMKLSEHKRPTIVNVGVVGNIIKQLLDLGAEVIGTDFDEEIIGQKLFGEAEIIHGSRTLEMVAQSDVAVVTGMTLATQTLDDIIKTARAHDTKLLIFAETGANLADFYMEAGIDTIVSEPFPFYIFQGKNVIRIFHKK